jgi:hypothetical protein
VAPANPLRYSWRVHDEQVPEFGRSTPEKRAGEAASAAAALPQILELAPATSLVHVGFRSGEWLAEARRLGVANVHGVDGPWAPPHDLVAERDAITIVDTRSSFSLGRTFDLAICVEYAEHLPDSRAASLVADLTKLAPVVAFSAAIPGQGGAGHVNEQWPAYWQQHFAAAGFRMVDAVRRTLWTAPGGPAYLAQNLFLCVAEDQLRNYPQLAEIAQREGADVLALVHPETYEAKLRFMRHAPAPGVRRASRMLLGAVARSVRRR